MFKKDSCESESGGNVLMTSVRISTVLLYEIAMTEPRRSVGLSHLSENAPVGLSS